MADQPEASVASVILTLLLHAPVGDVFVAGCLDDKVNTDVTAKAQSGRPSYSGLLLSYEVIEDGRAVRLTLDVDVDVELDEALKLPPGSYSVEP